MPHITLAEYLAGTIAAKRVSCRNAKNRKRFWTQAAIAKRAGLSETILGLLLSGRRSSCSEQTLRKLAVGLRVPLRELTDVARLQAIAAKEAEIKQLEARAS